MTKEQYLAKRTEFMNAAQSALNDNDLEKFNELKAQIEKLDKDFSDMATAQANLNALNGVNQALQNSALDFVVNSATGITLNSSKNEEEYTAECDVYKTAWLKNLREEKLTDEERKAFEIVNETTSTPATHTTDTNATVIPTQLSEKILRKAEDLYPIWGDTTKYHVRGTFTIILDTESGEATWTKESENTKKEHVDTSNTVKLSGNELAAYLEISWKARAMSIKDFEVYLIERLSKKMGRALAKAVAHGAGSVEGDAGQPLGIITYLTSKATAQITAYTENALAYKDVTAARGKVASGYGAGLVIYANANTIWNEIANVMDTNNRPIFISDTINSGGVGRMLGVTVKEDASFEDGEILFANMSNGYIVNIEEDLSMKSEETLEGRKLRYGSYMIVDGTVTFAKAFSLLKKKNKAVTKLLQIPPASTLILNKSVGDMLSDGAQVFEDGTVNCTFKHVSNFASFSSSETEQSGYYFPFALKDTGTKVTIKKNGKASKENIDFPDDKTFLFRVNNNKTTFEVIVDNESIIKLTFENCTFLPESN